MHIYWLNLILEFVLFSWHTKIHVFEYLGTLLILFLDQIYLLSKRHLTKCSTRRHQRRLNNLCQILVVNYNFFVLLFYWIENAWTRATILQTIIIIKSHNEDEIGALTFFGSTNYFSIEHSCNFLCYMQSKTNSFSIQLLGWLKKTKKLK